MNFDEEKLDMSNVLDDPNPGPFSGWAVHINRRDTDMVLKPEHCYLIFKNSEDLDEYKKWYKDTEYVSNHDFGEDVIKILRNDDKGIMGLKFNDQIIRTFDGTEVDPDELPFRYVITPFQKIPNLEEEEFYEIFEVDPRLFAQQKHLFYEAFISNIEYLLWDVINIDNPDVAY